MSRAKLRNFVSAAGIAATLAFNASPAAAVATPGSFSLKLTVPVLCRVSFTAGSDADQGGAFDLGRLGEYCNAGAGYSVVVDYAPGTLRGAVLQLGADRVVLDGSGEAVISQSPGARIRQRELLATPGANGFDSPQLSFAIRPSA